VTDFTPARRTRTPTDQEKQGRPWNVTILRAIRPDGTLTWPDHNQITDYQEIWESGGSAYFNTVWMQDPSGLAGEVFRPEWYLYYQHPKYSEDRPSATRPGQLVTVTATDLLAEGEIHAIIPDLREMFSLMACDLAIKQSDTADWYAHVNAYASRQGELFIEDVYRGRHNETEMVEQILLAAGKYKAKAIGIESVAFQSLVFRMVARRSQRHFVELDPANRDKVLRARPLAARYQMGKVFHLYGARWRKAFEYELQEFPGGKWDDQTDAAAYVHELAVRFHPDTWREVMAMQSEMRRRRHLDDVVVSGSKLANVTIPRGPGLSG
jgi:predicted phage terminase large subunit-like protein